MKSVRHRLNVIFEIATVIMFVVLFGTVSVQLISRYVFDYPFGWTTELATITFIWIIFWANSFVIPLKEQVLFESVYQFLPPKFKRFCALLMSLSVSAIFIIALPKTYYYFVFLKQDYTAVLEVTFQIAFLAYFIFALIFPARLLVRVIRLLNKHWQDEI